MRRRDGLLFVGWLGWACLVLVCYYVQVLRAVAGQGLPPGFDTRSAGLLALVAGAALLAHRLAPLGSYAATAARQLRDHLPRHSAALALGIAGLVALPWTFAWPRLVARAGRIAAPHFPFLGEAAARAGAGIVGAALVAAAALSAGTLLLRVIGWRAASRGEHVLFAAVSGLLVVSYGSLLLAVMGIYRPWTVAVLIAALCLAGAPLARSSATERASDDPTPPGPISSTAPWLVVSAVALGFAALAALAPEKEFDALWYHLNLPRLWLEAGRPVDLVEDYVSLYPLTWELLFGDGMALGGVAGAKLLHFACLPLLAWLAWHAARRYVSHASAPVAVALVVTTPTLLWQAGTAYVDLALALHAAAACFALARFGETDQRAWGIVAALQFGIAAATKHLGVIVTIVALTIYVVSQIRNRRHAGRSLRHALTLGLIAALIPMPWYFRGWLASGNPVFPELFNVFGAFPPDRWDAISELGLANFKAHFGMGRSPADLLALPWNLTVHGALFAGSVGPLFLILVPGLFLTRRRSGLPWLCAGVAAYLAVWASPISSFQMRFLMPIVAPLALLAAAALERIGAVAGRASRIGPKVLTAVVVLLAIINLPPFMQFHEADRVGWDGWLTHVERAAPVSVVFGRESATQYLGREVPSYPAWQVANQRLPRNARVLTFTGGDRLYARRRLLPYDATMARPALSPFAGESHLAIGALHSLGITHVLFDRRVLARMKADTLAIGNAAVQRLCVPEYDDRRFWLCRLDYPR